MSDTDEQKKIDELERAGAKSIEELHFLDGALLELIKVERRNLYGLKNISHAKRREKLEFDLDDFFDDYRDGLKNDFKEN